ncbi:MAG: sulfite exporter TauE/SafE family protein [Hyphomicrobiaceae bacterium]
MTSEIALLLAGALVGAFVNGLTGFGTGLTALVFWLHAVPVSVAAPLVAACSVVAQLQTLPAIWHALDARRLLPFVAGGLAGIPLGTWLLTRMPVATIKLGLGVLLVVYCSVMLFGRFQPRVTRGARVGDGLVGFAGGVLGGLAGLSGVLPTIWASLRGWSKDERRAVFQGFNLAILAVALAVHAMAGLATWEFARALAITLPATVVGALAGQRVYRHVADDTFQRVVLLVLLAAGLMLVAQNI